MNIGPNPRRIHMVPATTPVRSTSGTITGDDTTTEHQPHTGRAATGVWLAVVWLQELLTGPIQRHRIALVRVLALAAVLAIGIAIAVWGSPIEMFSDALLLTPH